MGPAPDIRTPLPGPKARAIIERDRRAVSPSYTRAYPFVMARGEGAVVEDVDGNRFLDCAAGIAVASTGHSHPDVVAALTHQARQFLHMSGTDFYYEPQVRLAEEIAALVPIVRAGPSAVEGARLSGVEGAGPSGAGGPVRSFFGNSGTEANEAAIKVARYSSGRFNLIAFLGAFHGRTLGSLALTASKTVQRRGFGPMMPGVFHAPYANCYRCPVGLRPESCEAECLRFLEDQLLVHLVSPDEVAAVMVEPIQGEGGYIVPPAQFHQRLRELTHTYGMLLIVDEVQSGMGRTGKMFAIEHFDVEPDIVTMAKGIASGLPLGIMTARADVMNWPPGAHASTFGGNPVSCAAALATLKLLREGLVKNAAEVGGYLLEGLRALMGKHPLIGDVRGRGLMIGVEVVRDRQTKERATKERDLIVQEMFARGVLILGAGANALRFAPPLVLTKAQAERVVDVFDQAVGVVGMTA